MRVDPIVRRKRKQKDERHHLLLLEKVLRKWIATEDQRVEVNCIKAMADRLVYLDRLRARKRAQRRRLAAQKRKQESGK